MIENDIELHSTLRRIENIQKQLLKIREEESSPENYRGSVSGFLAELDRMQSEVRDYRSLLPNEPSNGGSSEKTPNAPS